MKNEEFAELSEKLSVSLRENTKTCNEIISRYSQATKALGFIHNNYDLTDGELFEAFRASWASYPSQDNEGYLPDRGGFKCGFYEGVHWMREKMLGKK